MPKKGYGDSLLVTAISLLTRCNACHAAELSRSLVEWMWVGGMNVQNAAQLRPLYPFPLLHRNMNARGGSGFQSHKCTAETGHSFERITGLLPTCKWQGDLTSTDSEITSTKYSAHSRVYTMVHWLCYFQCQCFFPLLICSKDKKLTTKALDSPTSKKTCSKWEPEFFQWLKCVHFSDRA